MRYDILYTVYLPTIGEVALYFDTIRVSGYHIYISGCDSNHNDISLTLDKLVYPDEHPDGCGYCHIIAYTMRGQTTPCNYYKAIR